MVIASEPESKIWREQTVMEEKRISPSTSKSEGSQSRLHNFSLPNLGWGNQRVLRCVSLSNESTAEVNEPVMRRSTSPSLDKIRESSPSPLRRPLPNRGQKRKVRVEEESTPAVASSSKPWNLRTKKPRCNAPVEIGLNRNPSSTRPPPPSFPVNQERITNPARSLRSRSKGIEKVKRRKFSIPLLKVEIEEDFVAMKGTKHLRRPKKRSRYQQRQLDALFPGSLLTEVSRSLYKIETKRS